MALNLSVFITFVYSVRFMIQDPSCAETLKAGGIFWFPDLTVKDKHFYLPLVAALINYFSLDIILPPKGISPRMLLFKDFSQSMTVVFFPVMLSIPSGVFMYWIPSGLYTIFQRKLFTNNRFREMVGLSPIRLPAQGSNAHQGPSPSGPTAPGTAAGTDVHSTSTTSPPTNASPAAIAQPSTADPTVNSISTSPTSTSAIATDSPQATKPSKASEKKATAADLDVTKLSRKDRIKLAKYGRL
jgi:hypothetical protein